MVEWWILLRKTRMCSKEWFLNGLFLVFMSFWDFSFFVSWRKKRWLRTCRRGSECDLKENVEMPLPFSFSEEPLLLFALWCFVEMYPIHLLRDVSYKCIVFLLPSEGWGWRAKLCGWETPGALLGLQISGGDDVGVVLFAYFFGWCGGRRKCVERKDTS